MLGKLWLIMEVIAGILICVMCVVVFLTVADRFLIHYGFGWPEELARILLIWCSFLSACVVVRKRGNYVVSYFVEKILPKGGRIGQYLNLFILIWSCLALFILLIKGLELTVAMHDTFTPAMNIRQSWIYSSVPICSCAMIIFFFSEIYTSLRHLNKGSDKK